MLSLNHAFYTLKNDLQSIYDANEASAISHELLNHITGLSKYERIIHKNQQFTSEENAVYDYAKQRLLNGEPLQYITGLQWFMGNAFEVNNHVLIPRPETEELVQWIAYDWKDKKEFSILDIGTGSGCIAISLKILLPNGKVFSADISSEALEVAERNAVKHDAEIELMEVDFLDEKTWKFFGEFDVIVSNPPYIPAAEKEKIHRNVHDYEPEIALFVPDADPLLFYKKIALFAQKHLKKNGAIYCEVHKAHAQEAQMMFENFFLNVVLRKDMNDNERMVKCQ